MTTTEDIQAETSTSQWTVFKNLRDEALDLEMTDKFLASVERKNHLVSGVPYNTKRLHEAITFLASKKDSDGELDKEGAELITESELASWREILELRNNKIETYHIRRFYDNSETKLDMGLLISLARVLRSLPYSESNQSKYDLVVTRLFTKGRAETKRIMRLEREKVADAMAAILPGSAELDDDSGVENIIGDFDSFIGILEPISNIDEFIKTDTFEKLRLYKKSLGDRFFHPRVTAAAIECNITVGNLFADLVNEVNGPLFDLMNNKFDFAGAFHDVSASARTNIWDELESAQADESSLLPSQDHEKIREILELIEGSGENEIQTVKEIWDLAASRTDKNSPEKTAGERANRILTELGSEKPDRTVIRDAIEKYEVLKSIDLEYILSGGSDAVNEICRDALSIIIWSEELCGNELQSKNHLSNEAKSESATLIQLFEKYQCDLQDAMKKTEQQEQHRLLTISNKLLASHLDLKGLLVSYTKNNL